MQLLTEVSVPLDLLLERLKSSSANGKEVGAVYMPAPQSGSPMTYMWQGKQYIIVSVSGGNYSGEYIAYRLPSEE